MCVEFKNVQLNLNIPPGLRLSGDTTALLVQLNQLVCGVVWSGVVWCIIALCPEYIPPAWLIKEIQFVCYQANLLTFHDQTLLSGGDEKHN